VCTGAFVLAETGLLAGRRATTHWQHTSTLAAQHPSVTVEPDALYIRDGPVWTSAGVSAGIDLALALVEHDYGPDLARAVAREMVVFLRRPGGQSQFAASARAQRPVGSVLTAAVDSIHTHPAADHGLTALAARVAISPRHLGRLFRQHLGVTPAAYVETVRLHAAQELLEANLTVCTAARRSGLGSDETLRRVFLRHLGVTPTAYRAHFSTTTPGPDSDTATALRPSRKPTDQRHTTTAAPDVGHEHDRSSQ
jgi:transcriptional regulator GlxA family with amidase domain